MSTVHVDLPDSGGVEAAVVNEGAVFDEVRQDGAHRSTVVARGLNCMKRRIVYIECSGFEACINL